MKVVIADLCGTLILENTTHGYLASLPFSPYLVARNRLLRSRLGQMANRLAGRDFAREQLVRSLRGWSIEELTRSAQSYVQAAMAERISVPVRDALLEARRNGSRIYLATSSLQPIAEAVVQMLALDGYIATTLEFDRSGRCTGKILNDVTANKWRTLCRTFPEIRSAEITVYTDNPEDTDLKQVAKVFHYLGK